MSIQNLMSFHGGPVLGLFRDSLRWWCYCSLTLELLMLISLLVKPIETLLVETCRKSSDADDEVVDEY